MSVERNCYDCARFWADYDAGYSEYTPGDGLTISCGKGHWSLGNGISRVKLRVALKTAVRCPDFDAAEKDDEVAR